MDINQAMAICFKNGIKCYVVINSNERNFQIEAIVQGKPIRFPKTLKNKREANRALEKTYIFYANQIKKARTGEDTDS